MTFCVGNKQITPMLIEFSGGANTKSTQKKKKKTWTLIKYIATLIKFPML